MNALLAVLNKKLQEQISVLKQLCKPRCPLKYSILCLYRIGSVSAGGTHKGKKAQGGEPGKFQTFIEAKWKAIFTKIQSGTLKPF